MGESCQFVRFAGREQRREIEGKNRRLAMRASTGA
jgi:hypothetical protein